MPTPAVPTLTLCDQLVTEIAAAWLPQEPSEVRRDYETRITKDTVSALTGRKVIVIPAGYANAPVSRSKDEYTHRVAVIVAERYADAGVPLLDWVDERVEFVYSKVVATLDYAGGGVLRFGTPQRTVWTKAIDEVEVYDPDMLVSQKLFWSSFEFTFGEVL